MSADLQFVLNDRSVFGADDFPIRKIGRLWWVLVKKASRWAPLTDGCPSPFRTEEAAIRWLDNLLINVHANGKPEMIESGTTRLCLILEDFEMKRRIR